MYSLSNAIRTVSLSSCVTCPALTHSLSIHTKSYNHNHWWHERPNSSRAENLTKQHIPELEFGMPFSSIMSNFSCCFVWGSSLLGWLSLTPTQSWGSSSVTKTSSSKMTNGSGRLTAMCWESLERMKVKWMLSDVCLIQVWQSRGNEINALTFRCMNFCRGSYHRSRTSPEGTAAQRNVLSVYGLRARGRNTKIEMKKKSF